MDAVEAPIIKDGKLHVSIREFNKLTDLQQVQELERKCDEEAAPPAGKMCLIFTNVNNSDPLCRVRSYPVYCMLVAEAEDALDYGLYSIVGVIRAGIKDIIRPVDTKFECKIKAEYVTVMYISGLRVCSLCRRMGVGRQLVMAIESWGRKHGAKYSYLATENENEASVSLFTHKLGYIKFRSPSILVQPVHGNPKMVHITRGFSTWQPLNKRIQIFKLSAINAEQLYRSALGSTEFFPEDIHSVLKSPLTAGTWVACFKKDVRAFAQFDNQDDIYMSSIDARDITQWSALLKRMEEGHIAWAILSLWRYDKLIKFEVRGASALMKRWAALTRLANKLVMPWVVLPCLPNVFDKGFGVQLMYGLYAFEPIPRRKAFRRTDLVHLSRSSYMSRRDAGDKRVSAVQALLGSLCLHAHNMALQAGCKAVVAETGSCDPLKAQIPHWPLLSENDLWCLKRLAQKDGLDAEEEHEDWCKWPPSLSLFSDPRDF